MPTIPVRDTTLYYECTGTGRSLLFIHGMCGDADVWRGQVDRLGAGFTCITYDRRGHTRSALGSEPESVESHAADAAGLIEALGLDRPVVVGSSGGARIGVQLIRTRPDLVGAAVLSEPPIFSLEPVLGSALMAEIAAVVGPAAQTGGPRAAVDAFFPLVCPRWWCQLDEVGKERLRSNGHMMLAELTGRPYTPEAADLAGIEVPTLVVSGADSLPAFRAIAATLGRTLLDARFIELAGAGHVTYAERPDEFARAVHDFLSAPDAVRGRPAATVPVG